MNSNTNNLQTDRRTAADELFDQIRSDIDKMRLLPGTKLSEAEIARQYDVSRQPVREAFIRLDNLSLLKVRPQKVTTVRKISKSATLQTRFVRAAVEIEVARKACGMEGSCIDSELESSLEHQRESLRNNNMVEFHELDIEFHGNICRMADCAFAIEVINNCKAKVDRLCVLSLNNEYDAEQVYNDHVKIVEHLANKDEEKLVSAIREHLSRLDSTIDYIQTHHSEYFED